MATYLLENIREIQYKSYKSQENSISNCRVAMFSRKLLLKRLVEVRGQRDSKAGKALALHTADLGSITFTLYDPYT